MKYSALLNCVSVSLESLCVSSGGSAGPLQLHGSDFSLGPPVKKKKHPYKCNCAHLIDLSQARRRPDRLTVVENGKGKASEQTSGPVSAAEEVGLQVARRQRTRVWLPSDPSSSCQQWHFLTIHKQASQQRCHVLREWRTGLWVHFTTKPAKEAASYGCAHTHTRTPSHKHTPKAILLSSSVQTPLLKLNRGSQSLSGWCGLNITARNSTGWVRGREVAALCGQKASRQRQSSTTSNGSTSTQEA